LGVLAFSLFLLPGLPGCSGGQQDDEGLEASDDNGAGNAADGGSGGDKADDNGGGGDNNAAASDDDSGSGTADEGSGSGNSTENDLQEIITEMNGQNGSGSGDAAAPGSDAALPQNTAQTAPANAGATPPADAGANAKAAPEAKTAAAAPAANPPPFQPGGSSAGKNLPELGSKMAYVVQKGDTLGKISQKIYGSEGRWNELATLSGIPNPSRIFPGDLIYYTLDESAVTFASAYEGIQRSEEAVKQGDTLATIAKRVYGNPNAWRAIWRENDKIDNPDIIPPGTNVYYVSQGAAAAAVSKLQAEMAKVAQVKTTKGANLTTKASAKGSHAVAKNNVVSSVKLAKVQKISNLLADSQYFSGAKNFGTNEGNRLVVFN